MDALVHIFIFIFSASIVWFFSGILIESVVRVSNHLHKTGFTVAFFLLGFLTSVSEISVAINSTIDRVPQVAVGNLVGASLVVLLCIIPLLAVAGRGIQLRHTISRKNLAVALAVILLPVLVVIDGDLTITEGVLMLLAYLSLVWGLHRQHNAVKDIQGIPDDLVENRDITWVEVAKMLVGGAAIFISGHFLVEQAVYFAQTLDVPSSLIGLILLSIGTNVPELVIAIRSIRRDRKDVAFGDYLGSAAANTLIFGFLPLMNGGFEVEPHEFAATLVLMAVGLTCFYFFARSGREITRHEGVLLFFFYVFFLAVQITNLFWFSLY